VGPLLETYLRYRIYVFCVGLTAFLIIGLVVTAYRQEWFAVAIFAAVLLVVLTIVVVYVVRQVRKLCD
jgi:hypothetical protein